MFLNVSNRYFGPSLIANGKFAHNLDIIKISYFPLFSVNTTTFFDLIKKALPHRKVVCIVKKEDEVVLS